MIIVKLMGGLGNQMFQYAFGKALSLRIKKELKFDLSFYNNNKDRQFELNNFKIFNQEVSKNEIDKIVKSKPLIYKKIKYKIFHKTFPYYFFPIIIEKQFNYDPNILKIAGNNLYVEGYWQTEKYFKDYREELETDFRLKNENNSDFLKLKDKILASNSISIHIRRGDYVNNPVFKRNYGTCSNSYYKTAVEYINNHIDNIDIFVFSNDMLWAKKNLGLPYHVNYIDCNYSLKSCEELKLMSFCKHQIIANSSFSWWAGWLNNNPEKIVISPKIWFTNNELNKQSDDIIPNEWIQLEN